MHVLVAALIGGFLQVCASLVGRVLLALGIAFVSYNGFTAVIDGIRTQIESSFSGLSAEVVSFVAWMWVDRAIGVLFSAYTAAAAIKLGGSGTLKKMVIK